MKRKAPKPMQTMQIGTDIAARSLARAKVKLDDERRELEVVVTMADPMAFAVPDLTRHLGETIYREQRIRPTVTLRDDPLGHMYHRGRDDQRIGTAQYNAGRRFQRKYEAAGIGRLRSPGDIREHVDGGRAVQGGATDSQMQAHATLAHWEAVLGKQGYIVVKALTIDKLTIRQIAQAHFGGVSAAALKYAGWRVRECLSTLAKDMGLSS